MQGSPPVNGLSATGVSRIVVHMSPSSPDSFRSGTAAADGAVSAAMAAITKKTRDRRNMASPVIVWTGRSSQLMSEPVNAIGTPSRRYLLLVASDRSSDYRNDASAGAELAETFTDARPSRGALPRLAPLVRGERLEARYVDARNQAEATVPLTTSRRRAVRLVANRGDLWVDHAALVDQQLVVDPPHTAVVTVKRGLRQRALLVARKNPGGGLDAGAERLAAWVTGKHTRPRVAADAAHLRRALLGVRDEAVVVEEGEPHGRR